MNQEEKSFLFVCGCPRSGTSILASLLAAHSRIVLGIERYNRLFHIDPPGFTKQLFLKKRFFDVRDGESGVYTERAATKRDFLRQQKKWDEARVVGDKIPRLYERFADIQERFQNVKFAYIFRNILDVARSWQRRAHDGTWGENRDYKEAVRSWNRANTRALGFHLKNPGRIVLVDFEELYQRHLRMPSFLIAAAGGNLAIDPNTISRFREMKQKAEHIKHQLPADDEQLQEFVAEAADLKRFSRLKRAARVQFRNWNRQFSQNCALESGS